MKNILICLLLFVAQAAHAQFKVEYIHSADGARTFVRIGSAEQQQVAKRINAFVEKDWNFDPNAKDPFENLGATEEGDIHVDIGVNNTRVLSMIIETSYAAAGLHINRREYVFDSKTGASIDMNKLFGADGNAKLKKALHKSWKAALKAAAEDKDESRATEYKDCLTNDDTSETELNRMIIGDQAIQFWAGGCLEGTAYDFEADRTTGPHTYSLGQLLPILTQYGFSLFVDKGTAPLQTLLHGMIDGKYPISLALFPGKDPGTIGGMLVYDRVGEPLNLGGTMNGNLLSFHELDATGNPLSDIEVSWNGTKLTGSFINLKTKKQLAFEAAAAK
jgi:hypothetical protein